MVLARRPRLAIELALVSLVAWLAARSVSDGLRLAYEAPAAPPAPAAAAARVPVAPLADYAVIAERDVFNPAGGAAPAAAGGSALRLWGIGLHGTSAHAVIEDTRTHRQELYAVGDTVAGARVATIDWDRVTLAGPGGRLVLTLEPPADAPAAAPADAAPAPAAPATGVERIRRTGDNAWIVDRRALTGAADNPSALLTQLRAVAEIHEGRPAGFRLFRIDADSLFARLGLRDGDVVRRVNGAEVAEPAALLAFLERLRTEPRVAVDIVRGDRPQTLVYDLR
jgi:general secretion pathway protein C